MSLRDALEQVEEGQYVLKDIILVAAGMAIPAGTFRGGDSSATNRIRPPILTKATLVPVPGWRPRRSRAPQPDFS